MAVGAFILLTLADSPLKASQLVCFSLFSLFFLVQGGKGNPERLRWTASPPRASLCPARSGGPSWRDITS